jgi:ribonuclease P protein component
VAFALARSLGTAVIRNRLRRRLREIIRASRLPAGDYLIGARASAVDLSFSQLNTAATTLFQRCRESAGP